MITSTSNPKIKFLRKLRNKKFRNESKSFYIEGPRIIAEALEAEWEFKQLFFSRSMISDDFSARLLDRLLDKYIEAIEVDANVFESFSIKDGPKGLAAILSQQVSNLSAVNQRPGIWIGLDRIQDPGNLGSIFRTLDAVGGSGIILIDHCTDPFDINVIRGSMGAIFSLDLIKITSERIIEHIKEKKITLIGTSDHANKDYQSIQYNQNMILLIGSEREGLSEVLMQSCDDLIQIPMVGKSDSLNLAVATSICLYEIFNQRRKK